MELLAPAGNYEKLYYAYTYGADAAYIGISDFSLRSRADNFHERQFDRIRQIKGEKKLYAAVNIVFHNRDLDHLKEARELIAAYPLDAFIVSDLGASVLLRRLFPEVPQHLSTQANCINEEAARVYRDLGFSRVVLGRETNLQDIRRIKDHLPELELECFVHGAMCVAYSGRCLLSKYLTGRSANQGDCAHSCRWDYELLSSGSLVLEEAKRPGEYFPIIEEDGHTSILSSKDLCMIDHLKDLSEAGVDSLKIEGRMKSIYYTAVTTRAYRKALDALRDGKDDESWLEYKEELYKVSRREYSTGFYFDSDDISESTRKSYQRQYMLLGSIAGVREDGLYVLDVKNQIRSEDTIEYIGPEILYITDNDFTLLDEGLEPLEKIDHGKPCFLRTRKELKEGYIIRKRISEETIVSSSAR